ncbi:MAG: hypothetical protein AB7V50_03350 [Vampirovibrionia bacterium]
MAIEKDPKTLYKIFLEEKNYKLAYKYFVKICDDCFYSGRDTDKESELFIGMKFHAMAIECYLSDMDYALLRMNKKEEKDIHYYKELEHVKDLQSRIDSLKLMYSYDYFLDKEYDSDFDDEEYYDAVNDEMVRVANKEIDSEEFYRRLDELDKIRAQQEEEKEERELKEEEEVLERYFKKEKKQFDLRRYILKMISKIDPKDDNF